MAKWPPRRSRPKAKTNRERRPMAHTGLSSNPMKLPPFFEEDRLAVDAQLEKLLPAESVQPASIHTAMRYSVFAGGKRIRPILCLESARIFEAEVSPALYPGCAIEFIHTYSLIHDDLPALDNDDLRRGKPTSHKKFGEAAAILAGDALLTLAFETIAGAPVSPERCVAMVTEIATAAGTLRGMVGGQVADLEAEGKPVSPEMLEYIHRSKTAALIRASITSGALCAGAPADDVARLRRFGETIGWAFQVTDDILDVEESSAALGKTAGKDIAHQIAKELADKGIAELDAYGEGANRLRTIAEFLVLRRT